MSGKLPVVKTWRRNDEGHLLHDGDCLFWDRRVCICGLLHQLRPMIERKLVLMPDFYVQDRAQSVVTDGLLDSPLVKAANVIMEQKDEPLTDEQKAQIDKLLRSVGW